MAADEVWFRKSKEGATWLVPAGKDEVVVGDEPKVGVQDTTVQVVITSVTGERRERSVKFDSTGKLCESRSSEERES